MTLTSSCSREVKIIYEEKNSLFITSKAMLAVLLITCPRMTIVQLRMRTCSALLYVKLITFDCLGKNKSNFNLKDPSEPPPFSMRLKLLK